MNIAHVQNQDEYNKKYRDLADKSTKIQEKLDKIDEIFKRNVPTLNISETVNML